MSFESNKETLENVHEVANCGGGGGLMVPGFVHGISPKMLDSVLKSMEVEQMATEDKLRVLDGTVAVRCKVRLS